MYGIKAPGAESLIPFPKFNRHTESILNLFIGGLEKLCIISTPSRSLNGLDGLLASRSDADIDGLRGVCEPEGVVAPDFA